MRCTVRWLVACALLCLAPLSAEADDETIDIMAEPTAYTDVADAFDGDDPFDVNARLGFTWSSANARVEREVTDVLTADGRPGRRFVDVAEHHVSRNALQMGLELGVYQDLMVYAQLPVVLAETRELSAPAGVDCAALPSRIECLRLTLPLPDGAGREALFELGASTKRSGLPSVNLGVAWGPTNQQRGSRFATWVLRAQLTLPVGAVMHPCTRAGDECDSGISDGKGHLLFESRWSYRYRHVEPLLGLAHRFSWVSQGEGLYEPAGELDGQADAGVPSESRLTLGAAVIPWEDRGRHQRFALDTRIVGTLVTEGRDISPLFDALGQARTAQLRSPNLVDLASEPMDRVEVPFTGITRVGGYAKLRARTALVIQAARYVRFNLGLGLTHVEPHLLSGEPACNTSIGVRPEDPRRGACFTGLPNPAHRPAIDAPGQRFRLASELMLELFASASGQF